MKNQHSSNCKFILSEYFELLENKIQNILLRPENETLTFDILDTEKTIKNKIISLKEKQRQMKIGEIWQEVIGNYDGFINLKVGHATGLDVISYERKIIIELKNRTNTDNSSSKKTNLSKLAKFKKNNPEYKCIYANINENTEKKTLNGSFKKITFNSFEIEQQTGFEFLNFIFGNDVHLVIYFVKNIIDKYA